MQRAQTQPVPHEKGNKMAIALALLRTAALVGANIFTQGSTHDALRDQRESHLVESLRKNAASVFLLLFLRDIIRSLLIVGFIGVGAMMATFSINDDALFRASSFFSLAVLLVVVSLSLVAYGRAKSFGR